MWIIYESKSVKKSLKKIPKQTITKYQAWKNIVASVGPKGLLNMAGFNDESLKGKWKGCRSSRLGIQWRVIYKFDKGLLKVYCLEITPHKY